MVYPGACRVFYELRLLVSYWPLALGRAPHFLWLSASSTGAHTASQAQSSTSQIVRSPAEARLARLCLHSVHNNPIRFCLCNASTHAHRDSLDGACMHIAAPATTTTRPPTPRCRRAVAGIPRGARDSRGEGAPAARRMQVDRRRCNSAPHHAIDATFTVRRTQANTPAASPARTSNSSTRTSIAMRTSSRASACPSSS